MSLAAPRPRSRLDGAIVFGTAVLYVIPLALSKYFPGLDLPWHAAVVEILHRHDAGEAARDFLGHYEVDVRFSSYLTTYLAIDALAFFTGVAVAMQLVIALYVVAFIAAARRLLRAFGGAGYLAVLAAPAAYSITLEYGFLAYALSYPMTFWLWALVREQLVTSEPGRWRHAGIVFLSLLIAFTHPFACLLAVIGALVIAVGHRGARARAMAVALGACSGLVPLAVALATLAREGHDSLAPIARRASLLSRITTQQFSAIDESLAAAPARLFGFVPAAWCFAFAGAGIAAAFVARRLAGAPEARAARGTAGRTAWVLFAAACVAYLVTPFTFEWPWRWYAAQPRLMPLVWVLALVALRPRPDGGGAAAIPCAVVSLAALIAISAHTLIPFAKEAGDLSRVIARSAGGARTLGLIEHPRAPERAPASPWRHAAAYVLVERGGFVSNLPFTRFASGNAGALVPVRPAKGAPPIPAAPPPGYPRTFRWDLHGGGWDQFLIRDRDPEHPFDYFREHAPEVELVARSGRWRLYRRRWRKR